MQLHRMDEHEVVDAVATKCPKVFGSFGWSSHHTSVDNHEKKTNKSSGLGWKELQDRVRFSLWYICWRQAAGERDSSGREIMSAIGLSTPGRWSQLKPI